MADYYVKYSTENTYENTVFEAFWQYVIIPETNESQIVKFVAFKTDLDCRLYQSKNGYGFDALKVHCKKPFQNMRFEAVFHVVKHSMPTQFQLGFQSDCDYKYLDDLNFKVEFEAYLLPTALSQLPADFSDIFIFNPLVSILDNLIALNAWVHNYLKFETGVTDTETQLKQVLLQKLGVCQDFTHLFCAVSRKNKVPARYVSGYLHQGKGFSGDSQMHAWAEVYVPYLGWLGFDSANNLLVNHNHIKVSHGRDYADCSPIKGVIYTSGKNKTQYSVEVSLQQ